MQVWPGARLQGDESRAELARLEAVYSRNKFVDTTGGCVCWRSGEVIAWASITGEAYV